MTLDKSSNRRSFIRKVSILFPFVLSGCLDENDGTNDDTSVSSYITMANNTDTDHEVAFIAHDETNNERVVEEVTEIPSDKRHTVEFTIEMDDNGEDPWVWAKVRLDSLEGFDDFDSVEGPANFPSEGEEAEWPDLNEAYVGTEEGKLTTGGVSAFSGHIGSIGISLGIDQV
ncbi:hypothetical protein ACLI4Z_07080 [Natrialbaceae archaeon A-arb3/5]